MVVEWMHAEDIFELVSLVLSLIISWTFRILAHEEDLYTDILFVYSTQTDQSRVSEFGNSYSSLVNKILLQYILVFIF